MNMAMVDIKELETWAKSQKRITNRALRERFDLDEEEADVCLQLSEDWRHCGLNGICNGEYGMNYYKMEYERQHPRRNSITQTVLKVASVIIAIVIVAVVARLDAHADVAPKVIYQGADIIGKTAEVGIAPGVSIYVPGASCDETSTQNTAEAAASAAHEYSSITISDSEMEELKRIVAAEAQTQSMEGREAVVEVIFNRVLSPEYPNTVHGVLSQSGQFATWKLRNADWVVPDAATAAIEHVIENGRTVLPDTGYLYFSRGKSKYGTDWIKIQDHWFGRGK